MVAPRAPPKAVRDAVTGVPPEEDEDEELLRLRLPPDAPRWQRAALGFAQRRLRVPEGVLALAVHAGPRFWLGLLAWMAGARAAAAWELGPIYIIATILALMLLNLGTRREGEWSAYRWVAPRRGRRAGRAPQRRALPGAAGRSAGDLEGLGRGGARLWQCPALRWPAPLVRGSGSGADSCLAPCP